MRVICAATVDNQMLRENLCDCTRILGGKPKVKGYTVSVDYDGPDYKAKKFIELYNQYNSERFCKR